MKKTTKGYDEILNFSEFEDVVDLQKYKDLDSSVPFILPLKLIFP